MCTENSDPDVLAVQSTEDRVRYDAPDVLTGRELGILLQRATSPRGFVICRVRFQGTTQMRLSEHDEVVRAFVADGSGQPFGNAVLPARPKRDRLVTDAHCSQSAPHDGAVDLISIADQITWSFIPGKCLCDLTYNPLRGWTRCYVNPDRFSEGQSDDDEDVAVLTCQ